MTSGASKTTKGENSQKLDMGEDDMGLHSSGHNSFLKYGISMVMHGSEDDPIHEDDVNDDGEWFVL